MDPLLLIRNSQAGTAAEEGLLPALAILREHTSVEIATSDNPGELDGVLHRAGSRPIVVAGGDGSLHAIINALHRRNELSDTVLGLLPMGTGNDFARALGVPLDLCEAARLVLEGQVRPVDAILDDAGQMVVNSVHVGASAQASRRGHRWKARLGPLGVGKVNLGRFGYPIGALQAAVLPPSLHLQVEVDGKLVNRLDQPLLMVALGNGTSVGGGAEITPEADPEDGQLDIMISRAISPTAKFAYAVDVARASHLEREDVKWLRGRSVTISGEDFYASADGEITGPDRRRAWRLQRAAYKMILP